MKRQVLLLCAAFMLVLTGCSGTSAFYKATPVGTDHQTAVQYAKKVLQHHNVLGKEIVILRADPSVSQDSKDKLLAGYRLSVCSEQERAQAISTGACHEGTSWKLDHAISAYEGLANAQTEAEMQKASDDLVRLIADLVDLIAGVR